MSKVIDLEERRMLQHMRPLARLLYRLVLACRVYSYRHPTDPELEQIRMLLREFDKEIGRDHGA